MLPQLYTGASGMVASARTLDVVANNLANTRTPGYTPDRALFSSYLNEELAAQTREGARAFAQVRMAGNWRSDAPGPLRSTGNPLDLAIQGEGFFRVQTPQGERLTRAGAMQRLPDGTLATADGHPLLDENGRPIVLPEGQVAVASDGTVTVSLIEDGRLTGGQDIVARIGLTKASVNEMLREGASLWKPNASAAPIPAEQTEITQGFIEQSGVQATQELVNMIQAQRLFEMQQRVVNVTANTVLKRALDLAGVG